MLLSQTNWAWINQIPIGFMYTLRVKESCLMTQSSYLSPVKWVLLYTIFHSSCKTTHDHFCCTILVGNSINVCDFWTEQRSYDLTLQQQVASSSVVWQGSLSNEQSFNVYFQMTDTLTAVLTPSLLNTPARVFWWPYLFQLTKYNYL